MCRSLNKSCKYNGANPLRDLNIIITFYITYMKEKAIASLKYTGYVPSLYDIAL